MKDQPRPVLYIFAGLPGSGKTTLAKKLATLKSAAYLRIDTIEQGLRDLCNVNVEGEGYRLAYRVACDNLQLGVSVVADSCNPIELTRDEWEDVAVNAKTDYVNIEVVCSDTVEHRKRIDNRIAKSNEVRMPTWQDVEDREYERWVKSRLIIDTTNRTEDECLEQLVSLLKGNVP